MKWQHSGDTTVRDPWPCSELMRCYLTLGLIQFQHIQDFQLMDMRELSSALQTGMKDSLTLYIFPRLLGAHGYAMSCELALALPELGRSDVSTAIIRRCGSAIASSLGSLGRPMGDAQEQLEQLGTEFEDLCKVRIHTVLVLFVTLTLHPG